MQTASERLIRLRKVLGLSQREMAKEFHVSAGAVGSWEVGDNDVPGSVLKLIELYEDKLWPKPCQCEGLVDELVDSISESTRLKDSELLGRLRSALSVYLDKSLDRAELAGHVQGMALKSLVDSLGDARGIPMKVAQIAAFLDPRTPFELREVLEEIQTCGRSMPFASVVRVFEEEFGRHPDELFSSFPRKPVACASLGQVHRAKLADGRDVAVKVQYPDIRKKLLDGFQENEFIHQLNLFIGGHPNHELIQDFHQCALEECNYLKEADNHDRFYRYFANDADVLIPAVHFSRSRERVLTTDWVDGLSWAQFKRSGSQDERNRASSTMSRFFAECAFNFGSIHADPHPGNFIFTKGKLGIIDFGRVKEMSKETQDNLHMMHTLLLRKAKVPLFNFMKSNSIFKLEPNFDFERFWTTLLKLSRHLSPGSQAVTKESVSEYRSLIRELSESRTIHIGKEFFWPMIFNHGMIMASRADLCASSNWRSNLLNYIT